MLSPSTSLPFSCRSSATTKPSNCFSTQAARAWKFLQVLRRPPVAQIALGVVLAALSSKPCVISWPMTAPMPP